MYTSPIDCEMDLELAQAIFKTQPHFSTCVIPNIVSWTVLGWKVPWETVFQALLIFTQVYIRDSSTERSKQGIN